MTYVHQDSPADGIDPRTLAPPTLPPDSGIVSRFVDATPHSLVFHILECLPPSPVRGQTKLILLVHGFPDLAYSWRAVLPGLAAQGYHAVAYDTRGFGRTFSKRPLVSESFKPIHLVTDATALVTALGYDSVSCIVGHDFGTVTATLCGLARPDMFRSVVLMSHPVRGPVNLPLATSPSYGEPPTQEPRQKPPPSMDEELAKLPTPRKHYQTYYCTPSANDEMTFPAGYELHVFLRQYFHVKSADWAGNNPHRLGSWSAAELEPLPAYYIMRRDENMRQAVARCMADYDQREANRQGSRWLSDEELAFYVDEWSRTTFRGGLNWYRLVTQPELVADMCLWIRRKVPVPIAFVSGRSDWGTYQEPGALESLENGSFVVEGMYRGTVLVDGAGHWVNQEQPQACIVEILRLAKEANRVPDGEDGKGGR